MQQHFSMIRSFHLADLFTIGNAFCGVSAIFAAMTFLSTHDTWHIDLAAVLIPVALVFDVLDGRIARWRHAASPMGRELDSLADVVSFGVAPAAIAFAAGVNTPLDRAILLFFAGCGVSRLARYNVTAESLSAQKGKVAFFEGTPIPTSTILVLVMVVLGARGRLGAELPFGVVDLGPLTLHPLVLLFALSGSLMISKTLRIPKP